MLAGVVGWLCSQLLDHDRALVETRVEVQTLKAQFKTIDDKLDRLIERR